MVKISDTLAFASLGTVGVVAASFWAGYFLGAGKHHYASPDVKTALHSHKEQDSEEDDSESESESEGDLADVSKLSLGAGEQCKMVLVVRTDLGMTSGKIAAQCSHAALACYKNLRTHNPQLLRRWELAGQTKVALRCSDEEELLVMQAQAQSLNLCAKSIVDAGRTQIEAGSRTVLGIAGPVQLVNQVTGKLRLL